MYAHVVLPVRDLQVGAAGSMVSSVGWGWLGELLRDLVGSGLGF